MRIRFCGVRGSTPAPGAEFVRVGGHTSCVAVYSDGVGVPSLLLDAGTGIRTVTELVAPDAFTGTILLTHLHWDHVQGLPFFAAGDRPDARVRVLLPDTGVPAIDALARGMSPPNFPIGPDGLRGRWTFDNLAEGSIHVEGFEVLARRIPHKAGVTYGYRVTGADASVAYLPDHLPAAGGPEREAALALCTEVDVLIHGGQFVAAESATATAYGHATVDAAIELARSAGVGTLVLTHHGPGRTDEQVDSIIGAAQRETPLPVVVATQEFELEIPPRHATIRPHE
jgi:ribonuclease BN (tRNA processing enzyme)